MNCPHCEAEVFRKAGGVLKARTSILVMRKDGAEINCHSCRKGIVVPIVMLAGPLRKADRPSPRLVMTKKI